MQQMTKSRTAQTEAVIPLNHEPELQPVDRLLMEVRRDISTTILEKDYQQRLVRGLDKETEYTDMTRSIAF
jgi:hypothetical protein